jgi:hypothetical protein
MPRNGPFGGCPLIVSFCTHNINSYCIASWRPICQHERHFLYALLNKMWTPLVPSVLLPDSTIVTIPCGPPPPKKKLPLGCQHTNRVESSQTLESLEVHTDRVESNLVCVVQSVHQQQSSICVWAGIVSDYFVHVCPRVLLRRFTGTEFRYIRLQRYARPNTVREPITCMHAWWWALQREFPKEL